MKKTDSVFDRLNEKSMKNNESTIQISLLVNSIYFFIESVFIISVDGGYRLIAIHQGRLLTDETYKTSRGARIAFSKFYGYKAWKDGIKAQWSRFYSPEAKWIGDKLKGKN
ncbi:MAG: hypothetical protein MUF15_10940 [Acidobacteria bacterium]|jgi:hypothetical protein|nr:hypothetical protein [Acidobacteriota bacterium]